MFRCLLQEIFSVYFCYTLQARRREDERRRTQEIKFTKEEADSMRMSASPGYAHSGQVDDEESR